MTMRDLLPKLGIAAGIAVVVGIALFSSTSTEKRDSRIPSEFSPAPGTAKAAFVATSSNRGLAPGQPAPFAGPVERISRATATRTRFLQLARKDKYTAIDEALRLSGADRETALATLAAAWRSDSRRGFKELAQIIDQISAYTHRIVVAGHVGTSQSFNQPPDLLRSLNALSAFPDDPDLPLLTMRLANRLLDGQKRVTVLKTAALAYLGIDPSLAYTLGSSLGGPEQRQFIDTFSKGWAARDPEATAQWATSIGDPDMRASTLSNAIRSFSKTNPARAAQWLESLPAGSSRQAAIRELGATWADQDTAAALAWASQLPDAATHQQAISAIQSVAPVGVGISITRPQNSGYPNAAELVPTSPAAQSGSVRTGDQIVGVLGTNQQWVGTANLTLPQVVSLIRGTAGAPVQLRLLPAGATDLSLARTVTIVRQQILFKRPPTGS